MRSSVPAAPMHTVQSVQLVMRASLQSKQAADAVSGHSYVSHMKGGQRPMRAPARPAITRCQCGR